MNKYGSYLCQKFLKNYYDEELFSLEKSVGSSSVYGFYPSSSKFSGFRENWGLVSGVFLIVLGGFIGLKGNDVLMKWVGMEIMFFGVVGVMARGSSSYVEAVLKYFLIQGLGGMLIFLSLFSFSYFCSPGFVYFLFFKEIHYYLIWSLLVVGLFMKLGVFPFDYWVPGVFKNCSYFSCFLIGVVQKFVPVFFLSGLGVGSGFDVVIYLGALVTAVKGCIQGWGVKDVRFMLGYSSLVHSGWIVALSLHSCFISMSYLCLYFVFLGTSCYRLYDLDIYHYLDLYRLKKEKISVLGYLWYDFFSLGGIPLSVGWVAKFNGFNVLKEGIFCLVVLTVCSAFSFVMYISLGFKVAKSYGMIFSWKVFKSLESGFRSSCEFPKGLSTHFWLFMFSNLMSFMMILSLGGF